jgi:hypothetical protein
VVIIAEPCRQEILDLPDAIRADLAARWHVSMPALS